MIEYHESVFPQLLLFSKTTDGRDKLLKVLQYVTKLIRAVHISKHTLSFQKLSSAVLNTRKLFRLGKSITEAYEIYQVYQNPLFDQPQRILQMLRSLSLTVRWFFDNLNILALFKVVDLEAKQCLQLATGFWLLSLVFNLIDCSREMMKSYAREATVKEKLIGRSTVWMVRTLSVLSETRRVTVLEMTRTIGDMIVASNGTGLLFAILGKQFSEMWAAIAGIVAGVIDCYQVWINIH